MGCKMHSFDAQGYLKKKSKTIFDAIDWRLRARMGDEALDRAICRAANLLRPHLKGIEFFAVAGSVGKTTAKDFLLGVLGARAGVVGSELSLNRPPEIAKTILRVRPWHRYCVAELGETGPDSLDELLHLFQPKFGLITTIGNDHLSAFGSHDAIAREFAKLAHTLPGQGVLVLNHDDERVLALRSAAACRVITFGLAPGADLRASKIVSAWPERLSFLVTFNNETLHIHTRMHGRHLLTSAMAAICGGLAAGLTLAECASGIATVTPAEGRMKALHLHGKVSVICDDFKAPAWTVRTLFAQLHEAKAKRKILVMGSISDCQSKEEEIFKLAREALDIADIVIFTGRMATAALKASNSTNAGRLFAFSHPRATLALLESIQREGDLIVIKGTNKTDHLSRIYLSLDGKAVKCWAEDCKRDMFCKDCSHLHSIHGPSTPPGSTNTVAASSPSFTLPPPVADTNDHIAIGLGNHGLQFAGTPHNIGREALDYLASLSDSPWIEYADAWIAAIPFAEYRLWLIKLKSPMNLSGEALHRLASQMGFAAIQCILIFDDIHLPLGKIRTRMNGSSGGHRGVASILEAFQTDAFRRVKIGVRTNECLTPAVLQPLDDESCSRIHQVFPLVAERIRQLAFID